MDHMDGLSALLDQIPVVNFWHPGVSRPAPEFNNNSRYKAQDWARYTRLWTREEQAVTVLTPRSGQRFAFASRDPQGGHGDSLYVLSPDNALARTASESEDPNDGSLVVLHNAPGGRILIPGDAHDSTWEHLHRFAHVLENCEVLIAPHHGRASGRDYEFLDWLKPKLTLFGCAPSAHLAYAAWNRRDLAFVTSNQAGNIVLDARDPRRIAVHIENRRFASAFRQDASVAFGDGVAWLRNVMR
jgi:beta-lactamase superfamily II metal-dependent hydrolase